VTPPDVEQSQSQDPSSKLQDVIAAVRPHLTNGEFQELEEIPAEYKDIISGDTKSVSGLAKYINI
jgi:hypothetical protein